MRTLALTIGLFAAGSAAADVLVPARTIRAREIITAEDLVLKSADIPGTLSDPREAIGQEARVALYAGRPLRPGDVGPPALVGRNDIVALVYTTQLLRITAEGRALDRAAAGEQVRVMNMSSRATVTGIVRADGSVEVR